MSIPEITVQELKALRDASADFLLLDVRNPDEHALCNLGGLLIPLAELPARLHELKQDHHTVIFCHGGGRSRRATEFLMSQGFTNVHNLRGGITAWANEIDLTMAKY